MPEMQFACDDCGHKQHAGSFYAKQHHDKTGHRIMVDGQFSGGRFQPCEPFEWLPRSNVDPEPEVDA